MLITNKNTIKTRRIFSTFRVCFLISSLFFYSCKKSDIAGLEVQPDSDKLNLKSQDTTTLFTYTVKEDSIRADETSLSMLGSYIDPDFGYAEASIFTQLRLSSEKYFDDINDLVVDSVVLSLVYYTLYGDFDQQKIRIFELSENIDFDSTYYSNKSFNYSANELASILFIPNLTDSVSIGGTNEPPQLRVKLDNALGQKLLTNANNTNEDFIKIFKGLYITSDNLNQTTGEGAIIYFDLLNQYSKLTLFYRNTTIVDTFTFDFVIDKNSARVNHFKHDYTGTTVQTNLNDTTLGKTMVYIQSMAGIKTKVIFPYINNLINSGLTVINKAELVLTVENNTTNDFPPHEKLYVVGIDSTGNNTFLTDQFEGDSHYGGLYNSNDKEYIFNITRHIQEILSGKTENNGLYIIAAGSAVNANRTILTGSEHASKMKLIIAYTPL